MPASPTTAIALYDDVDISVAVSIPDGLITPIVRKADQKGLAAISSEMKDLAARARSGKLKPEEFQGGGFSISNMGMYGVSEFAAIINPPQAAILAVAAGQQRPVVKNGALAIATVMTCTLSVDHRVVDGALGRGMARGVQGDRRGSAEFDAVTADDYGDRCHDDRRYNNRRYNNRCYNDQCCDNRCHDNRGNPRPHRHGWRQPRPNRHGRPPGLAEGQPEDKPVPAIHATTAPPPCR